MKSIAAHTMTTPDIIGITAALGSAASWALGTLLYKQLGTSLSSSAMTFMQGVIGVLLLGSLTLVTNDYFLLSPISCCYLALSGFLGIALSGNFFFRALRETGAQTLTLFFTLGQVTTVLLAIVLLGERLSFSGWLGISMIAAGITAGILPSHCSASPSSLRGIVYGMTSIILMSCAAILTKKGLDGGISTTYATFIRMLSGTCGMLFLGVITRRLNDWVNPFREHHLIWKFIGVTVIITFGGFWLSIVAFKHTTVTTASSLIAMEPIMVLLLSFLFMKHKVTFRSIIGVTIATTGAIFLCTG